MKMNIKNLKEKLHGEVIFTFCLLAYILYILIACITYRAYTRYIPLLVGSVALVLIIYTLYKAWTGDPQNAGWLREHAEIMIWTFLCPVMIFCLGFIIGGPLYCFMFSKIFMKEKWLGSIVPAVIILIFIYALQNLLRVYLHRGFLLN